MDFHGFPWVCIDVHRFSLLSISLKHKRGRARAGLALNPGTPVSAVEPLLDTLDLVLVMSVNPGYGGQSFIASQLEKVRKLRILIDETERKIDLQVDGGINAANAANIISAGADVLVAGSATFTGDTSEYAANIDALRLKAS